MRIRLLVVGRGRKDPILDAAQDYLTRLGRYGAVELIEVKEESRRENGSAREWQAAEAQRLRRKIDPGDWVVALDERGVHWTSRELATKLQDWAADGRYRRLCFLIGGPDGLDQDLLTRAHVRWSLSPLTFPHHLARLVTLEQLYRGQTLLRGEPYHR